MSMNILTKAIVGGLAVAVLVSGGYFAYESFEVYQAEQKVKMVALQVERAKKNAIIAEEHRRRLAAIAEEKRLQALKAKEEEQRIIDGWFKHEGLKGSPDYQACMKHSNFGDYNHPFFANIMSHPEKLRSGYWKYTFRIENTDKYYVEHNYRVTCTKHYQYDSYQVSVKNIDAELKAKEDKYKADRLAECKKDKANYVKQPGEGVSYASKLWDC